MILDNAMETVKSFKIWKFFEKSDIFGKYFENVFFLVKAGVKNRNRSKRG